MRVRRRLPGHMLAAAAMLIISGKAMAFDYAPIDCSKADSAAAATVCRTYSLGQAEARMATLYGIATALVAMGERGAIADAQIQWLKAREACGGDASCLASSYRGRIQELTKILDGIVSRGPF